MKDHATEKKLAPGQPRPVRRSRSATCLEPGWDTAGEPRGAATLPGLGRVESACASESSQSGAAGHVGPEGAGWQWLLQSAALAAANGVLITDQHGFIVWANPAFSQLTGYRPEEIVGKNPRIFKSGRHPESFYRGFWGTILSGRTWRGEFINRRKDGTIYVVEQTVTPVRQGDGQITHFISITEDVTGRKRLEEELRQAQKLEAVGQLAAGVAHVINNVLTVIRCNSELLLTQKDRLTPAESAELLQHLVRASDRAARMTGALMAFCQQQVVQRRPINVNEAIEMAIQAPRRVAGGSIRWHCRYAPDLPSVPADARMIHQMILNLVSNALDAMPGGGRLIITTQKTVIAALDPGSHPEAQTGEFVCVSVSDNGCGIAPEILPRIFDPFFTTKDVNQGAGLGLAVAYGIMKQHRGWIDVTSKAGRGTTFRVFLPIAAESEAQRSDKSFAA